MMPTTQAADQRGNGANPLQVLVQPRLVRRQPGQEKHRDHQAQAQRQDLVAHQCGQADGVQHDKQQKQGHGHQQGPAHAQQKNTLVVAPEIPFQRPVLKTQAQGWQALRWCQQGSTVQFRCFRRLVHEALLWATALAPVNAALSDICSRRFLL